MSDKQKSIISLAFLKETCDVALASIAAADGTSPDDLHSSPDFALIRKDFISILAYLYSATTKTALSLKPASPTYSASLSPLKDLSTHVHNLSHNVRLIRKAHGMTLLKEMQSAAQRVVSSIQNLSQALLSDLASSKEYLTRVGEIHHAIEKVRGSDGLSTNNVAAAHKVWLADQASLEDALRELQEIPESGDDVDGFDDGWDELGIVSSPNLSSEELEWLKKVESIVKLSNLMHKTVIKKVLASFLQNQSMQQQMDLAVDVLAEDSSTLPAAVDDLISTVYSPQDTTEMAEQLGHLGRVVEDIQAHLSTFFALEPVEEFLKESVNTGKKTPDVRKWFETCFGEIKKLITQVSSSLQDVQ